MKLKKGDPYLKEFVPEENAHGPPRAGRWARRGNCVAIGCPDCGTALDVSAAQIDANGSVNPSVGHAFRTVDSCQWQMFIQLLGWTP